MLLRRFVVVVLLLVFSSTAAAREWTSADGKYKLDAEYVGVNGAKVKLKKANGQIVEVLASVLSKADQDFIAEQKKVAPPAPTTNGDLTEESAKAILEENGMRILSSGPVLNDEAKFSTGLKDIAKARKNLVIAGKELAIVEKQIADTRNTITQLTALNVQLNAQLAAVAGNVTLNNKLVGALNANDSQITLLEGTVERLEEQLKTVRAKSSQVREEYLQQVLDLRKLADAVARRYQQLAVDEQVKNAVDFMASANGKSYAIAPSREFNNSVNRLKTLEDTVLSESIALRMENGKTPYVSVMVNGKHTTEMVVDSGSSLIMLPRKNATEMGIEVTSQHPEIQLVLADGRRITGNMVMLDSIRVGKFSVDNVECAVLGPEATEAEPLLGMSFLEKFKFEVNTNERKLTMVKIEGDGGPK